MNDCKDCDFLKIERVLGRTRELCTRNLATGWHRYPSCHDQRRNVGVQYCGPEGKYWQSEPDIDGDALC